jgi:hypothetical protein
MISKDKYKMRMLEITGKTDHVGGRRNDYPKGGGQETMNLKSDEVSFLRGHVAQLTQSISQLSLPPSQEEARAKSWWRFWNRK